MRAAASGVLSSGLCGFAMNLAAAVYQRWSGNSGESSELQALRQELADTQKKLQGYADTVISLYDELRTLRENICTSCREKFVPNTRLSSQVDSPAVAAERCVRNCPRRPQTPAEPACLVLNDKPRHASPDFGSVTSNIVSTCLDPFLLLGPFESLKPTPLITSSLIGQSFTVSSKLTGSSSNAIVPPSVSGWSVQQDETGNGKLHVAFLLSFVHRGQIRSVRFSSDGKYLAAALRSGGKRHSVGELVIFDIESGSTTCVLAELTSQYPPKARVNILCLCFAPNSRYLAVGDTAGRVIVWDFPNRRMRNIFRGHTSSVESVDFSPNGQLVASASWDKTVRIWNIRDGSARVFSNSRQSLLAVRFNPNGQYFAAGNSGGALMIWNLRTGLLLDKSEHQRAVLNMAFMPDGKGLVSGGGNGTVKYWDLSSLGKFQTDESAVATEILEYKGHTTVIKCIAVSPDAQWVASASYDKTTILWDTRTAVRQCTLVGHKDAVVSVDFSPAGTYLATASQDGHVTLWRYTRRDL